MRELKPGPDAAAATEALLARLYTDPAARSRFLADPQGFATAAGLPPAQAQALEAIDRTGLILAGRSYAAKRAGLRVPSALTRILQRLWSWWR